MIDSSINNNGRHCAYVILTLMLLVPKVTFAGTQQQTFDFRYENESLVRIVNHIQTQSNYRFVYNSREIKTQNLKIDINMEDASIYDLLKYLKQNYPLDFLVNGNTISMAVKEKKPNKPIIAKGYVTDLKTGERLVGVNIYNLEQNIYSTTNSEGFYSILLPTNKTKLCLQYLGYEKKTVALNLAYDSVQNISLTPNENKLTEVVVGAKKKSVQVDNFNINTNTLSLNDIKSQPTIGAENDILKIVELLPGINYNSNNQQGYSIRGSSDGANLIVVDHVPIYQTNHTVANLSIFNQDVIRNISIRKGGIPPTFGGKASALMLINTRNGNTDKFSMSGGISNISSRLTLEGPILKSKLSFLISARRGGENPLSTLFTKDKKIYFYDLNAKISYKLKNNSTLLFSFYWGKDRAFFVPDKSFHTFNQWRTNLYSLQLNRIKNSKLSTRLNGYFSLYDYFYNQDKMFLGVGIYDFGIEKAYNWYVTPSSILHLGVQVKIHSFFNPFIQSENKLSDNTIYNVSTESSLYIQNERKLNNKIYLKAGCRVSLFNKLADGKFYSALSSDTSSVDKDIQKADLHYNYYLTFLPSFELNYRLSNQASIKFAYNRSSQYLHQLTSINTEGLMYRLIIPCNDNIKPLIISQYSMGFMTQSNNSTYGLTVESYYKFINNTIDYRDNVFPIDSDNPIENYTRQGKGNAYGIEFMLKKEKGRLNGTLCYTLAHSGKRIKGINNNKRYLSSEHIPHNLSISAVYKINEKFTFFADFVLHSGIRYSDNNSSSIERNMVKSPVYHRADLGISFAPKRTKRFNSVWKFSIYNVYNRQNAYFLYGQEEKLSTNTNLISYNLYDFAPSISWSFKF